VHGPSSSTTFHGFEGMSNPCLKKKVWLMVTAVPHGGPILLYKQSETNPKKSSERKSCACVHEIVAGEENAYARGTNVLYVYKYPIL
jgi:hypothetical protein